jgi:MYXO-CTERM domain-containing protein
VHAEFRRAVAAAAVTGALGVAGCGEQRAAPVVRQGSAVVRGEVSPPGGSEDAVLLLRTELDGEELVCSASLLAKNLAITARHCVSHLVRGLFTCTVQGELESEDEGAGLLGSHLPAEGIEFYDARTPRVEPIARGSRILSTLSETICVNDVAFVVLDRALELPILPLRIGGRALRDEPVTLVGYGFDDAMSESGILQLTTQPRTRQTGLVIAEVGPDSVESVTTAPPRTVVVEGPSGCVGDSGGPLLAAESGAVIGVYSLLAGTSCLSPDVRHLFSHVPVFRALIDDAFAAADAEPTPEPSVAPAAGGAGQGAGGDSGGPAAGPGGAGGESQAPPPEGGEGGAPVVPVPSPAGGESGTESSPEQRPTPLGRPGSSGCAVTPPAPVRSFAVAGLLAVIALALQRRRRIRAEP